MLYLHRLGNILTIVCLLTVNYRLLSLLTIYMHNAHCHWNITSPLFSTPSFPNDTQAHNIPCETVLSMMRAERKRMWRSWLRKKNASCGLLSASSATFCSRGRYNSSPRRRNVADNALLCGDILKSTTYADFLFQGVQTHNSLNIPCLFIWLSLSYLVTFALV